MSIPLSVENRKKKRMHEDSDLFENLVNEGTVAIFFRHDVLYSELLAEKL